MTDTELELPQGWELTTLSQISIINPKKSANGTVDDELEVSFLPMKCVEELSGKYDLSNTRNYGQVKKGYTYFKNGDIIFAKITPCMENGKIAIVDNLKNEMGFGSTEFHVIRLKDKLVQKYYFHYLLQDNFRYTAKQNMTGTAGQLRVSSNYLKETLVPLPPLNEQKRIVSKIEELLSKIDSTKQSLEQIKIQIEQYRASFLESAFEGKLTEKWRENNVLEHSSVLLEKIKQDQTKTGRKIKKLVNFDSFKKYELPDNWIWTNILSITKDLGDSPFGSNLKSKDYVDDGIPVIHGRNIKNNEFKWAFPLYVTKKKFDSLERSHCHPDDIIFQKIGSVGLIAILPQIELQKSFLLSTNCMKISTSEKIIPKKFIFYYFIQAKIKEFILKNAQGTTQPIFNFTTLKSFPIPLPSTKEQEQIVSQIEQGFSLIENTSQIVDATLQNLQTMKISVLKQAFEGKLVPQDPNDEPASVLLERIKLKN